MPDDGGSTAHQGWAQFLGRPSHLLFGDDSETTLRDEIEEAIEP
jgi:hypothetical protein